MIYGLVVKGVRARGWLWAVPLTRALQQGRPCVLLSALSPDADDFDLVLRNVPGAELIKAAILDGRLSVVMPMGDNSVNLFRQGARGFVRELEALRPAGETLFVIDEADDLFTSHDPRATQDQAACYRDWCEKNGHTVAMIFLRVTLLNPLLGGNQAALSYFDGLGEASVDARGLNLRAEFWDGQDAPDGIDLATMGMRSLPATNSRSANGHAMPAVDGHVHTRPRVWYVGRADQARSDWVKAVEWQVVESLDPLLEDHVRVRDVVVALDKSTDLDLLLSQLLSLRARAGDQVRVILREVDFRLREYPQRLMLIAAGAHSIVAHGETLERFAAALTDSESGFDITSVYSDQTGVATDDASLQSLDWLQHVGGGRLPIPQFLEEVESILARSERWDIPCTLAEVPRGTAALNWEEPWDAKTTRPGDFSTQAPESDVFFLQGCRPRDAVRVVERLLDDTGGAKASEQVVLYGGPSGVRSRLEALRSGTARMAPPALVSSEFQPSQANSRVQEKSESKTFPRAAAWAVVALGLPLMLAAMPTQGIASEVSNALFDEEVSQCSGTHLGASTANGFWNGNGPELGAKPDSR